MCVGHSGLAGWPAGVCGPGQQDEDADADNAQSMNCIKVMNPSQDIARKKAKAGQLN